MTRNPSARRPGRDSAIATAIVMAAALLLGLSMLGRIPSARRSSRLAPAHARSEPRTAPRAADRTGAAQQHAGDPAAISARHDPPAELALIAAADSTRDEKVRQQAEVLVAWARRSPREAWQWVRDNVDCRGKSGETPAAIALLQGIAAQDPTLALSFVNMSFAAGVSASDLSQLTYVAAVALVTTGHADLAGAAIEQWLERQPAMVDTRALSMTVLALAATHSPAEAAAWLTQLPGAGRYGAVAATLAADWAEHNPSAALQWAQALPVSAQRDAAMRGVFAVWSDHDPDAATQWFLQHEAQADSDQLIPTFIEKTRLGFTDPAAAVAWASLPRDASLRSAGFEIVLRQWAERDAPAAARFLAQTTAVPGSVRDRLAIELGLSRVDATTSPR